MRKILLSIAVLLFAVATSSQAQIIKFGLLGGANSHTLNFQPMKVGDAILAPNAQSQYGYQVGAALRISLPDFLQIQTELIYHQTNSRILITNDYTTNTYMSMEGVDVPLMIGFNIKAFRVFAGPVFHLSSDFNFSQKYNNIWAEIENPTTSYMVGAGFDIGKFFIDARYSAYWNANVIRFGINGESNTITTTKDQAWVINCGFFF